MEEHASESFSADNRDEEKRQADIGTGAFPEETARPPMAH